MPLTIQCPYWKRETEKKSICEGCTLRFAGEKERKAYMGKYCANIHGWKTCSIAMNLEQSYEQGVRG